MWAADITYIPIGRGFLYLVAIIDWASRAVLAWRLSNTMDGAFCGDALDEALARFGRRDIFDTDQGSQSISAAFTGRLASADIRISMDGRWMQRLHRTAVAVAEGRGRLSEGLRRWSRCTHRYYLVDRSWKPGKTDRARFERVAGGLCILRVGAAGVLALEPPRSPDGDDALFARARSWTSMTPYRPTRHAGRTCDASTATTRDLIGECLRRGLPRPEIEMIRSEQGPRGSIRGSSAVALPVSPSRGRSCSAGRPSGRRPVRRCETTTRWSPFRDAAGY
ncbi:MAG: transposase family protein [Rhodospirillales bacterium]|nr:transposase family protein [Rhodospirillales bacterium]